VEMRDPAPAAAQHAFVDALRYFSIGVSWGGYESLALPVGETYRDAPHIRRSMGIGDEMYRLSIGLEAVEDLIEDLERGFAARAAVLSGS
jgi:cystathionine beta-lyase